MEKPKPKLGKSKSSNGTIFTNADRKKNNKKTASSAEFKSKVLKKRGVYVEKKITQTSLDDKGRKSIEKTILKSQTRERQGKKKCIKSVYAIMSKSTIGTQFDLDSTKPETTRLKIKKASEDNFNAKEVVLNNNSRSRNNSRTYKSKILNKKLNEGHKVVVLQSKKHLMRTSSIYSDRSNVEIKWNDFPRLVEADDNNMVKKIENNAIYHCVADGLSKKERRVTIDADPKTLVSDKPNDKLYNFFVDLLETTLSVCSMKAEFNKHASASSSKIALQIDESAAKKLETNKWFQDSSDESKYYSYDNDKEGDDVNLTEHFQTKPLSVKISEMTTKYKSKKRKVAPQNRKIINTQSFFLTTKKSTRKDMKNNLLKLFKQQLMLDSTSFEEPENMYQALKYMAKNKRRYQNSIQFDGLTKFDDSKECRFKRRNVISRAKKLNKKHYKPESEIVKSITSYLSENIDFPVKIESRTNVKEEFDESKHSLEVLSYDFDKNVLFRTERSEGKTIHKY